MMSEAKADTINWRPAKLCYVVQPPHQLQKAFSQAYTVLHTFSALDAGGDNEDRAYPTITVTRGLGLPSWIA
jgi:hypothetical protein